MTNRIREIRELRGLSLQALADLVGTSNQNVSRVELGQTKLNEDWMRRLGNALDVDPVELLSENADYQGPYVPELMQLAIEGTLTHAANLGYQLTPAETGEICVLLYEEAIEKEGDARNDFLINESSNIVSFAVRRSRHEKLVRTK